MTLHVCAVPSLVEVSDHQATSIKINVFLSFLKI